MKVINVYDYSSVHDFNGWGGAIPVLTEMYGVAFDYVDEFIESVFPAGVDETVLNDWLWFECEDWLAEVHGIHLDGTPINADED